MKVLRMFSGRGWWVAVQVVLAGYLVAGCQSPESVTFSPVPGESPGETNGSGEPRTYSEVIRAGELVVVKFSGIGTPPPTHEERVKEDGTITLPDVGAVKAADKSPGELQKELTESYRKYYNNLVVTVILQDRVYYVGGQVRTPGPKGYLGKTTITMAIQHAGDFTDFANKKKVWLTRPGQKPVRVNVVEALKDPAKDLPVFPGDRIDVPKRWPG